MIRAGRLRCRVTIERAVETRTGTGAVTTTWSAVATRQAAITPLTGREYAPTVQQFHADVDHEIRLRWERALAEVRPKMRVTYGARVFDIQAVQNVDERNVELVLLVKERL